MSDSCNTTSPSAGDGGAPAACATAPCPQCWMTDHQKEISISTSYGRYCRKYKPDGTEYSTSELPVLKMRAKIYAPLKTGPEIGVEVRFKAVAQAGVSTSDVDAAKAKLESGVNTYWNGRFQIEINDPLCGKKTLPVKYRVVWVTSGENYLLNVYTTWPREGEGNGTVSVQASTSAWIFAHEFGHCVGLPDEYSTKGTADSVRYIKPDGTLDASVTAPAFKAANAADATIMSSYGNTTRLARHCWNVAIEVQDLLRTDLGRNITCTVL